MRSGWLGRGGRAAAGCAVLCAAVAFAASLPSGAAAAFRTGFQEDAYVTNDAALRESLFDRTVAANASVVRINVSWRVLATAPPARPADPADPAYRFGALDAAVEAAAQRGLLPLLTINDAPGFARLPGEPNPDPFGVGSWKPDPAALADFSRAVATRYSGGFAGLPRVTHFQIWNEPNLSSWLRPQRKGEREVSPDRYRELLNAAYAAIKEVHADNQVVSAGTAPFGDKRGPDRVRPLEFLRKLLCLRDNLKRGCKQKTKFDILAHHPINALGRPRNSALHHDDATTSDFNLVVRTLRAAERANTVTRGRHQAWATEIWWETNPPDTDRGRTPATQARWLQQALFILWRQGADVVLNFQVEDEPYDPERPQAGLQSGVYFASGEPKPSATAWEFPFMGNRRSKRRVDAWGIAPVAGKLRIERLAKGDWRKIGQVSVDAGKVFTEKLSIRGQTQLRATVGGQTSLEWKQR